MGEIPKPPSPSSTQTRTASPLHSHSASTSRCASHSSQNQDTSYQAKTALNHQKEKPSSTAQLSFCLNPEAVLSPCDNKSQNQHSPTTNSHSPHSSPHPYLTPIKLIASPALKRARQHFRIQNNNSNAAKNPLSPSCLSTTVARIISVFYAPFTNPNPRINSIHI